MNRALALSLLVLAGCPGKKGPDRPPANVTCDNVGASIAVQLADDVKQAPDADPKAAEINNAVVAAVIESCNKDAWTAEARGCFVDARADGGADCRKLVTDAQAQALDDRMDSAVAKVAPASCDELGPLIRTSLASDIASTPPAERDALSAKIDTFAGAMTSQCTAGWTAEARTCVRDSTRAQADPGRCARWFDEAQRAAYQAAVVEAFGEPPPPEPAPAPAPAP